MLLGHTTSRSALFVAGLLVGGCGKVGEVPKDATLLDAASSDAPAVDASSVDAPVSPDGPSAACDLTKPFAPATEVPGLHEVGANDIHGSLTADEHTIYFGSNRFDPTASTMHIYTATRATPDAAFSLPTSVGSTFSTQGESNPSISPDGNTIYFDSYRVTQGTLHIFTSTRANAAVVFPEPTMIAGDFLHSPSITADGKVLYVANLSEGALGRMDKLGTTFGASQTVAIPSQSSLTSPVTSDDLTLYMSLGEQFGDNIQVTKRTATTNPFPAPALVTELKTNATQAAPSWASADGCRLYVTYMPPGDTSRIYVAARPR